MRYRWLVSAGVFIGCISTFLIVRDFVMPMGDHGDGTLLGLALSFLGTGISLVALFHHPANPDPENVLDHRATALIAIGLNSWLYFFAASYSFWR